MTDYRSTKGKFEYSERLDAIYSDVVKRMRTNRFREDTLTGTPPDGKEPFIDVFLETRGEPFPTRIAKAIVRSWMVSEIPIYEGDLLIGCQRPERIVREHFSFGIQEHRHMFDWCDIYKNRREELEPILDELHSEFVPLDWDHLGNEADKIFTPVEGRDIYHEVVEPGLWWVGGFQGHTVPNYQILMDKGIGGVHVRVCERLSEETDQKKIEMLTACKIILEGLRDWILMQADAAEKKAAEGGKWADSLIKIAENCRAIALDAPKTYYQACQLCWFYSLWDWVDCVGRIDQFMYPFFQKALEEDRQFCEDCTAALMLKFLEHGIHNMTIGGCDPKTGEDVTNELSFLYLQIARRNHETHPRISLRIGENTDPALLALGVQMWSEGMSDPTVASDTTIIPAFIKNYGVEPEDARNYTLLGCQELEIPGKSNFGCEDGMLNLGKIVFATCGSDDHRDSSAHSLATFYSSQQHADAFLELMRKGDFSAGPVGIRMAMGDVVTGGQTDFTGKRLVISVGDWHPQAINQPHNKKSEFRLDIYNEKGLVTSIDLDGTETQYFAIDAENCQYYRAEVYDVTNGYWLSVGNPIWNTEATATTE